MQQIKISKPVDLIMKKKYVKTSIRKKKIIDYDNFSGYSYTCTCI